MKKSIFLFFAAILCAMSVSAKMVYLKPGNWLDAGADVWVHSWGGTQGDVAGVLKPVGLGLYGLDIKNNTKCLFVRQSGGQSGINWDSNWYKTGDLTITSEKECYHISGWDVKGWIAVPSAHIAGAEELTGHNWSASASDNKMTKQNDGTWTLTKTIASINQGDYGYKVTDGSWDWSLGKNSNDNATINIPATGKYSVTFTYNPSANTVSAVATPIYSVTVNAGEGGTASGTGECVSGNSVNISAEALENYEFVNWTITSGTGTFGNKDAKETTFQPTNNATIQANFRSTVTYSLTLQGDAGIATLKGDDNNVTLGKSYEIQATLKNGYKFAGWTADVADNAEITDASLASTSVTVKNGSVILSAKTTEILAALTTANSFDAGTPSLAVPTASVAEIGVTTTSNITATAAPSGYTFVGWTLTNCERTDGGANNATTITVKSTGTDAAATATANYEIDKYYVVGSFNGWNTKDDAYKMTYDNGVYKQVVTFAKDVQFKICNGSWGANWGYDNLYGVEYKELEKSDDQDKNIKVTAEGNTTFTIVFNLEKNLITFEGLTNKYTYVLMGVDNDWDNGIEMALSPAGEYVLTCQTISITDAVKVVKLQDGAKKDYFGTAEYGTDFDNFVKNDQDGNIVLIDGTYDFYFKPGEGKIWIENATNCPEEIDIEITDLMIEESTLSGTADLGITMTFILSLIDYDGTNKEYTLSDESVVSYGPWGMYRSQVTGSLSKSYDVDLDTDVFTGVVYATIEGVSYKINLTMYNQVLTEEILGEAVVALNGSDLTMVVDWEGIPVTIVLPEFDASSTKEYGEITMEIGSGDESYYAFGEPVVTVEDGEVSVEGEFYSYFTAMNYNVFIWGAVPSPAPETYTRTVTNTYGTICLEFGSTDYTGATFYQVAGKETGKVYLESVSTLTAGIPYIFEATATEISVTSNGTTAATAGSANGLIGTFEEITVPDGDYILYNNAFCTNDDPSNPNKIRANRAYLDMDAVKGGAPQQMPGRRYIGMEVEGESTTTGLDNITNGENTVIKVIKNGQLIIIREGEKYNAQGQRL